MPRLPRQWLKTRIDKDEHLLEYQLLALAVAVGIVDAVSYPRYHCFTSNQTGNTVLFAVTAFSLLGDSTRIQIPATHLGVSLASFCLGVMLQGQIAAYLNCRPTRLWLLLSSAAQTTFVLVAALTDHLNTSELPNDPRGLVTIALLAASSGAQVAMSRGIGVSEIPTTQATTAYVDLFLDPTIFAWPFSANRSRNRRVAFLLALLAGSFIGAPLYKFVSPASTIVLAAGIKAVVTFVFAFNRERQCESSLA